MLKYICCCLHLCCGSHFANLQEIEGFTTLITLFAFFATMTISGFVGALPSTLQATFGFSVFQATIVCSTVYTITKMICSIPLTYLCGKTSIPYHFRWMVALQGAGTLLFAVVGLMAQMAQDEAGMGQFVCWNSNTTEIDPTTGETLTSILDADDIEKLREGECTPEVGGGNSFYFIVLCLSMALQAVGVSCLYTLGPAHINANSTPEECARLLSWFYMVGPIGMAIGFVGIGMLMSSGAWWMGFAFTGVATLSLVPLFMKLPAVPQKHESSAAHHAIKMPEFSVKEGKSSKVADRDSNSATERQKSRRPSSLGVISVEEIKVVDFRHQVQQVFLNPVWFFNAIGGSAEVAVISGYSTHGAQFLESYTGLSRSFAPVLAGIVIIPAAAIGSVLGGQAESRWHKNLPDTARWNIKMAAVSAIIMLCFRLFTCDQANVIGADLTTGSTTTPSCAADPFGGDCGCNQGELQPYYPICFNNQTFYSPCHAGCSFWNDENDAVFADNCTCADSVDLPADLEFDVTDFNPNQLPVVTAGYCSGDQCQNLGMILIIFFLAIMVTFMNNIPMNVVLMRSVPTEFSGLSLGMNDFVDKLLGDLPGGLVLGSLLDSSCAVKDIKQDPLSCEDIESCALFRTDELIGHWATVGFIGKIVSFLLLGVTYYYITKDDDMKKDYSDVTTKTGNFRRLSLTVQSTRAKPPPQSIPSIKEEA